MDAIFRVDGNNVVTSPFAAGPWDPSMQHGSPPAALVVFGSMLIMANLNANMPPMTMDQLMKMQR